MEANTDPGRFWDSTIDNTNKVGIHIFWNELCKESTICLGRLGRLQNDGISSSNGASLDKTRRWNLGHGRKRRVAYHDLQGQP